MKFLSWIFYGFALLLSLLCCCMPMHAEVTTTSTNYFKSLAQGSVLACNYCNFLNEEAVSDPDFLYDPKMGSDAEVACIVRVGTAGKFHYEVIEGRENVLITFVNENDAVAYSHWLANGAIVSCIPASEENNSLHSLLNFH